jgi:hypothetical protein
MVNKVFQNFMYEIETGLEPPAHIIFKSARYRRLREALAKLPAGQWLRVYVGDSDGLSEDQQKRVIERFRQAAYNAQDALKLKASGQSLLTRAEYAEDGKLYAWIGKMQEPV